MAIGGNTQLREMVSRLVTADGTPYALTGQEGLAAATRNLTPVPEPAGTPVEQERPERTVWHAPQLTTDYLAGDEAVADDKLRQVDDPAHANLVSSLGTDGKHYPAIDLDMIDLELRDSSTPGHTHLYINHAVEWDSYVQLLDAMVACKLVEPGYVAAAKRRGQTMLRRHPTKHVEGAVGNLPAFTPGHVRTGGRKPIRGQLRAIPDD